MDELSRDGEGLEKDERHQRLEQKDPRRWEAARDDDWSTERRMEYQWRRYRRHQCPLGELQIGNFVSQRVRFAISNPLECAGEPGSLSLILWSVQVFAFSSLGVSKRSPSSLSLLLNFVRSVRGSNTSCFG